MYFASNWRRNCVFKRFLCAYIKLNQNSFILCFKRNTSHTYLWILSRMIGWGVRFSRQQYFGKKRYPSEQSNVIDTEKKVFNFCYCFYERTVFYSNTTFVRFTSLLLSATITSENVRLSARCRAGPIMSIIVPRGASLGTHPLSRRAQRTGSSEWAGNDWKYDVAWHFLSSVSFKLKNWIHFNTVWEYIPFKKLRVIQPTFFPFNITHRRYILAFSRYWTYIVRNNCLGWEIP